MAAPATPPPLIRATAGDLAVNTVQVLIAEHRWTVAELARVIPCHRVTLSRIVHGHRPTTPAMTHRIAELLHPDAGAQFTSEGYAR